jgi:hypothetical protein
MNDHIPDLTKMIGDTPRTNAAELEANIGVTHFDHGDLSAAYHFARQLERELDEANKTNRLQYELITTAEKRGVDKSKEELNAAKERIKRLEEALEARASDNELNQAWELYIKTKEAKP